VFYLFAYDWAKSRSIQLSGASVSDDEPITTGGRALIAAMVADASALDFEMNPNPLQRKHTPFARRYPRFPVPLHFGQELEVETIVIVLDMCKQCVLSCVPATKNATIRFSGFG
jgi:hypothetical protein